MQTQAGRATLHHKRRGRRRRNYQRKKRQVSHYSLSTTAQLISDCEPLCGSHVKAFGASFAPHHCQKSDQGEPYPNTPQGSRHWTQTHKDVYTQGQANYAALMTIVIAVSSFLMMRKAAELRGCMCGLALTPGKQLVFTVTHNESVPVTLPKLHSLCRCEYNLS